MGLDKDPEEKLVALTTTSITPNPTDSENSSNETSVSVSSSLPAPRRFHLQQRTVDSCLDLMSSMDFNGSGFISAEELDLVLKTNKVHMSAQDRTILIANFEKGPDGMIAYHAFCDAVFDWNHGDV